MSRRVKADPTAWRSSAVGIERYRAARTEAQAKANEIGADFGLEFNDLFKEVRTWRLPARKYRAGHELRCEVVSCESLERAQSGHGVTL